VSVGVWYNKWALYYVPGFSLHSVVGHNTYNLALAGLAFCLPTKRRKREKKSKKKIKKNTTYIIDVLTAHKWVWSRGDQLLLVEGNKILVTRLPIKMLKCKFYH
jgi:hypothetical protein